MHLSEFNHELLKKAVSIYMDLAYEGREPRSTIVELDYGPARFDDLLNQFLDESKEEGGRQLARYALRLGNRRYPFMKFVLQEFIQPGNYYFSVDTHDEMNLSPDVPGYEDFLDVRSHNRNLKCSIEMAWAEVDLPTIQDLRKELGEAARGGIETGMKRGRVLVAEDDVALAGVMEAILMKYGFEVTLTLDGKSALDIACRSDFDLVICDYQMPVLDGAGLCKALREQEGTREVPVLLTTEAALQLAEITDKANGFLVKPYREDVLMGLIDNLLGHRSDGEDGEGSEGNAGITGRG